MSREIEVKEPGRGEYLIEGMSEAVGMNKYRTKGLKSEMLNRMGFKLEKEGRMKAETRKKNRKLGELGHGRKEVSSER